MSDQVSKAEKAAAQVRGSWSAETFGGNQQTEAQKAIERLDKVWESLDRGGRTQLLTLVTNDLAREVDFMSRNVMSLSGDDGAHLLDTAGRWLQARTREVYPVADPTPAMAAQRHRAAAFVLDLARPSIWTRGDELARFGRSKVAFDVTRDTRDMLEEVPDDLRDGLGRDVHDGLARRAADALFQMADARMEMSHAFDAIYERTLGRQFRTLAVATWNEVGPFARGDLSPTSTVTHDTGSLGGSR